MCSSIPGQEKESEFAFTYTSKSKGHPQESKGMSVHCKTMLTNILLLVTDCVITFLFLIVLGAQILTFARQGLLILQNPPQLS